MGWDFAGETDRKQSAIRKAQQLAARHGREWLVIRDETYPNSQFFPYHVVDGTSDEWYTFFQDAERVYSTADEG